MHMSSVGLYKGHVSLGFLQNWLCLKRNESEFHWQSKFLLSLSMQVVFVKTVHLPLLALDYGQHKTRVSVYMYLNVF